MSRAIRIIAGVLACALLVAGGIGLYAYLNGRRPVEAVQAGSYMMTYEPNQSWLYGITASRASQSVYKEQDRRILSVLVSEGDAVHAGDPLIAYDTARDALTLEGKKLELEKLYNTLQADYKTYFKYAKVAYEPTVFSPTPVAEETPSAGGTGVRASVVQGVHAPLSRIASSFLSISGPTSGAGSDADPFIYSSDDGDALSWSFLKSLTLKAAEAEDTVHAIVRGHKSEVEVTAGQDGTFAFAVTVAGAGGSTDLNNPKRGAGTKSDPFVYQYGSGATIPATFISDKSAAAAESLQDVYVTLKNADFKAFLRFGADGTVSLYVTIIEPTPTPSPTPTPDPYATPTPTPDPEETPVPYHGGLTKAEREALAKETLHTIKANEVKYRQLLLDIRKLEMSGTGILYATMDGTVTLCKDPSAVSAGDAVLTVSGGSGIYIAAMISEADLAKYPVGTVLEGFCYETGSAVTCTVTAVGDTPLTENYSNGGNPNSSGYLMQLEPQDASGLTEGAYIEFTYGASGTALGRVYLYEAFVSEEGGHAYIYVVREGTVRREQVTTGRRAYSCVELKDSTLTESDYIVFPGQNNCRDGARASVPGDADA